MKKHEHIVKKVQSGSIAEELGIEPGDRLLEIDGNVIEDIFDYQFYVEAEELVFWLKTGWRTVRWRSRKRPMRGLGSNLKRD
mgnify:CR=1 FL=1